LRCSGDAPRRLWRYASYMAFVPVVVRVKQADMMPDEKFASFFGHARQALRAGGKGSDVAG